MTTHVLGTEPYAWPYDGCIDGAHLALVLAGWDQGWRDRATGAAVASARCDELAVAVEALGGTVVLLAHAGAPVLATAASAPLVVSVPVIDGFHGTPLDLTLRSAGLTHLLVAGHGIEAAVHSTLRSANDRGYECLLVTDACSSLTEDLVDASAKVVTMSGGIFGAIGTTRPVLDALADLLDPSRSVIAQEA
jgi:biuret amidohydrolase